MADYGIEFEAPGLEGLKKKLSPEMFGRASRFLLEDSAKYWRNQNRIEAPRWRGELISSQSYNVDPAQTPQWAKVGSNSQYAKPQNYGTGTLSIAPDSSHRRHFPPPGALQGWAIAHGFTDGPGASIWSTAGGKVSRAIGLRGGLRPNEYMKRGLRALKQRLPVIVKAAIDIIEKAWSK